MAVIPWVNSVPALYTLAIATGYDSIIILAILAFAIVSGDDVPTLRSADVLKVPVESLTIILFVVADTIVAW